MEVQQNHGHKEEIKNNAEPAASTILSGRVGSDMHTELDCGRCKTDFRSTDYLLLSKALGLAFLNIRQTQYATFKIQGHIESHFSYGRDDLLCQRKKYAIKVPQACRSLWKLHLMEFFTFGLRVQH